MKKEKKVVYGIEIVKPWSDAMYAHNEEVAEVVRTKVHAMWVDAITKFAKEFDYNDQMLECEFTNASDELKRIQRAVTVYGFGFGYDVNRVAEIVQKIKPVTTEFLIRYSYEWKKGIPTDEKDTGQRNF